MIPADFEGRACRRRNERGEVCGHHRHSHLRGGACTVKTVSGPPSDHPLIVSKEEGAPGPDMHPGRTVEACWCPGFLA